MGFVTDASAAAEPKQFITNYDMWYDGSFGGEEFFLPDWNVNGQKIFFRAKKPNLDPDEDIYLLWGITGGTPTGVYGMRNGTPIKTGLVTSPSESNELQVIGNNADIFTKDYTYAMDVFFVNNVDSIIAKYDITLISKNGLLNAWAKQTMLSTI